MSLRVAALVSTLALSTACESPVEPTDAGTDAGSCEPIGPFEHGGDGHPDPLGAGPTEARAGRAEAAELPTTPSGLELWRAGDFLLANDRIAVVIEDTGDSDLYDRFGGRPVGLALVEDGAMVRPGDFEEFLFGVSTFLVRTERVSVIDDGSGGAAVIRASGPLAPIDFAGSLLDAFGGADFAGEQAAIDYTLEPGASRIEVALSVVNPRTSPRVASRLLMGFFQSSRMPMYTPGEGFADFSGALPYVGFDDEWGGAGWAWAAPEGRSVNGLLNVSGVGVADMGRATLAACATTRITLGYLVVGDGLVGAQADIARAAGTPLRTLTGTVTEADGTTPAGDARVHVLVDDVYYARAEVADDGGFSLEIPMAGTAEITAYRRGFPTPLAAVPAGADPNVDVSLPAFGEIHVVATEDAVGVPARVQVFPASGSPARPPSSFGERSVTSGRVHVEFPTDGEVTLRVPPGDYRVVVSRGFEYDLFDDGAVRVSAGATTEVAAPLSRIVDTTGVVCADYHIHTTRSPDAPDDARFKVSSLVADGLEIAIRSDHEFVNDFQPVIDGLGLDAYALGIAGEELTTFEWGHFGVFPLEADPMVANGTAVSWVGRRPPDVFAEVRSRPEAPAFIVNHPRSSSFGQGYFEIVGYDALTGMVDHPEDWDEEFTIVEAFNDSSFEQNRGGTVVDWFSFLNRGRRMFAVGSSDSHGLYTAPVGYPRTCLALGSDDPAAVSPAEVRDATVDGHAVVAGGLYLTAEARGGAGPGDEVTGASATEMVRVVVRGAPWIDADTLEVIVDGTTTETVPLARDGADPTLLLDATIAVPVAAGGGGSWAVFHASGDEDMADVYPGREPFAVSNPIFFRR